MSEAETGGPTRLDPFQEEQTVLILVGLIAAGKSTFAQALEKHFPQFCHCNQDDLGNRQRAFEDLAYQTLCEGRSACIDRSNFNALQRSKWTSLARSFPKCSISVIVFDTPYQVCASRLERRKCLIIFLVLNSSPTIGGYFIVGTSHPRIKDVQHGMTLLQRFASGFQLPSPEEGYDHIIYLRPEDHPYAEYTRNDVLSILERLQATTRDTETTVTQP